jgi:gamma-glutamyltranspeptidase
VIVNVVDRGLAAQDAVDAPRVHYAPDEVFAEPGIPADGLAATGLPVTCSADLTCTSAAAKQWCATGRRAC